MFDAESATPRYALRTADRPGGRNYPNTLRERVVTYARQEQAAGPTARRRCGRARPPARHVRSLGAAGVACGACLARVNESSASSVKAISVGA
jgi:hypothetical protein